MLNRTGRGLPEAESGPSSDPTSTPGFTPGTPASMNHICLENRNTMTSLQNGPVRTLDGNEATAHVAYRVNEICAIYPITPSSSMGEFADMWATRGIKNIWGNVPCVAELQSEGGASGALHGALQTGALTTTFTASQGLLLMIPNMYKIAGELTAAVLHVSARSLAAQALSIFGDHSDVMAARSTGFAQLCSSSVQEAHDLALIAQAASLEARLPFIHFFDGFRTSHEVAKITMLSDEQIRAMIDDDLVFAHRSRGLNPDHPVIRGTAQNPDVFFQARETVNPFYDALPDIVEGAMNRFAEMTGRKYRLFDYHGAPDAERVLVLMGSGAEATREAIDYLEKQGDRVGMIQIHLYRPFSARHLLGVLPETTRSIAVLDRTKEPGAPGEPLYQDVVTTLSEAAAEGALPMGTLPGIVGGRYGLSSKEFTPAMVKGVLDNLDKDRPKNHFTIGIRDDVTHTSLDYDPTFHTEAEDAFRGIFYGLGADGTVGANKNSIKIIGEETDFNAQGFFVYDSKKSGSQTTSHLRFGPDPIRSTYLIQSANFIGCHQFNFLEKADVLKHASPGATLLLNSPYGPDEVWDKLPRPVQEQIIEKKVEFYVIDAYRVAEETGMGSRMNTILQTCFFAISGVLPKDEAILKIKEAIEKTYGKRGKEVVEKNFMAVDKAVENLHKIEVPTEVTSQHGLPPVVSASAPEFVQEVTAVIMAGRGDELPVSAMPLDGTYPTGTTQWEKRNVSLTVPVWEPEICIQCGNCSMVCPHGVIRAKHCDASLLEGAPEGLKSSALRVKGQEERKYILQVAVEDCTGCALCVETCPTRDKADPDRKAINMAQKLPILEQERQNLKFFETIPDLDTAAVDTSKVRGVQFLRPLFEYSGACAGCGETPYVKLLSQLFGDRLLVANATGCSSIYGGNLPTTPWTVDHNGRGPAWSNSLFEDNAEFGFGFRLTLDQHGRIAEELLEDLAPRVGEPLVKEILEAPQETRDQIGKQRERVAALEKKLAGLDDPRARQLLSLAGHLVRRSVWIMGGDGWAYDIGFGGLDHVLASGKNVNVLVLDTEVYSNTGGQASKATPRGAVARFAEGGKQARKKDLGMLAISYGNIYVAQVAMGAKLQHTLSAFREAEAYRGPSLIIAYSHCIAHGINMQKGLEQQKLAVDSGYWPLFRYQPGEDGPGTFRLDSKPPAIPFKDYAYNEVRYNELSRRMPEEAARLLDLANKDIQEKWRVYQELAARGVSNGKK